MGGHELLTARAEGLAFVTLVVNDSAYGILRNYQETMFGRTVAVELNAPDFAGLAEACGVRHVAADGIGGLGAALGEALADLTRARAGRAQRGAESTRAVGESTRGNPGFPREPPLRLAWRPRRSGEERGLRRRMTVWRMLKRRDLIQPVHSFFTRLIMGSGRPPPPGADKVAP